MKHKSVFFLCFLMLSVFLLTPYSAIAEDFFNDVPKSHWAFDAIKKVTSNGMLQGYPDRTFKGKKPVSRYALAMMIAKILAKVEEIKSSGGTIDSAQLAQIEKLTVEFADELALLGVKIKTMEDETKNIDEDMTKLKKGMDALTKQLTDGSMQRVKLDGKVRFWHGDKKMEQDTDNTNNAYNMSRFDMNMAIKIDKTTSFHTYSFYDVDLTNRNSDYTNASSTLENVYLKMLTKDLGDLYIGKYPFSLGNKLFFNESCFNGIGFKKNVNKNYKLGYYFMDNGGTTRAAVSGITDSQLLTIDSNLWKNGFGIYYYSTKTQAVNSSPTLFGLHTKGKFKHNFKWNLEFASYDADNPANTDATGTVIFFNTNYKLNENTKIGLMYATAGEHVNFGNDVYGFPEAETSPFENAGLDGEDHMNSGRVSSLAGHTDIQLRVGYKMNKKMHLDLLMDMVSANDSNTGAADNAAKYDILNAGLDKCTPFDVTTLNLKYNYSESTKFNLRFRTQTIGDNESTPNTDEKAAATTKQNFNFTEYRFEVITKF